MTFCLVKHFEFHCCLKVAIQVKLLACAFTATNTGFAVNVEIINALFFAFFFNYKAMMQYMHSLGLKFGWS